MADAEVRRGGLGEIAALFLKLGAIGFGGSAAHIAMMEEEVVVRRRWVSHERFLDLVGLTSVIPGPNATEMALYLGFLRRGWPGLLIAGVCFIFPAIAIATLLAWAYMQFGAVPFVAALLYGLKPAVLAVILGAAWRLGKRAVKDWRLGFLGAAVVLVSLTEFNDVVALLGGGLLGMFWLRMRDRESGGGGAAVLAPASGSMLSMLAGSGSLSAGPSLWTLGLFFLKLGAILYGSGYVLVAFLQEGLVHNYGWLTQEQLLEAVAIGQFAPGSILSAAAFIGFLVTGGEPAGALVGAGAIFLPSFIFVAALNPVLPRLRASAWMRAFLDAVNVCAVGLMVSVTIELGYLELDAWPKIAIAVGAALLSLWRGVGAVWLVLGGAVAGWAFLMLGY